MGKARDVIEEGERRFNTGDVNSLLELYAANAVATGPGGMEFKGIDAIREYTKSWLTGFPDAHIETKKLIEAGVTVVTEGIFTGTHTGTFSTPMGDIPPTGKAVKGEYVDIFEVRDGKVVSDRLTFDRMQLMEQLGLVPQPAGAGTG